MVSPGTLTTTSAVQLDRAGPRDAVFTVEGASVFYRGHYRSPDEAARLLDHLGSLPADDYFRPDALRLAEELAAAMREARYSHNEGEVE